MNRVERLKLTLLEKNSYKKSDEILSVGEIFEFEEISDSEIVIVVNLLLQYVCKEKDEEIRGDVFWSINEAVAYHDIGRDMNLSVLVDHLSDFSDADMEYIFYYLGLSKNTGYIPLLTTYLSSSNEELVREAQEAIDEIMYPNHVSMNDV
jgi:hypothetical protein